MSEILALIKRNGAASQRSARPRVWILWRAQTRPANPDRSRQHVSRGPRIPMQPMAARIRRAAREQIANLQGLRGDVLDQRAATRRESDKSPGLKPAEFPRVIDQS